MNGTCSIPQGVRNSGQSWSTVINASYVQNGTQIWYSGNTYPFEVQASNDNSDHERVVFKDMAVLCNNCTASTPPTGCGSANSSGPIAFCFWNARQIYMDNIYVGNVNGSTSSWNTAIEVGPNGWQSLFTRLRLMNWTQFGLYCHDQGCDDSTAINLYARSYQNTAGTNTSSVGIELNNAVQNFTCIDCDVSDNGTGINLQQGDSAGNGTGIPYAMSATIIGVQCEDEYSQCIGIVSSNHSAATSLYPNVSVLGGRVCGNCAQTASKNTTTIIGAQYANDVTINSLSVAGGAITSSISSWTGDGTTVTIVGNNGFAIGDSISVGTVSCAIGTGLPAGTFIVTARTATNFSFLSATAGSGSSCTGVTSDAVNLYAGLSAGLITRATWNGSTNYITTPVTGTGAALVEVHTDTGNMSLNTHTIQGSNPALILGPYGAGSSFQGAVMRSNVGSTPSMSICQQYGYTSSSCTLAALNASNVYAQGGLSLAGSSVMNANHGNGTNLQHSDGTGASHVAAFSATGDLTDGGTGTAGKATCWKTTGTIGYCSTQPDATGACTCN